jgi:hypothetical protein
MWKMDLTSKNSGVWFPILQNGLQSCLYNMYMCVYFNRINIINRIQRKEKILPELWHSIDFWNFW